MSEDSHLRKAWCWQRWVNQHQMACAPTPHYLTLSEATVQAGLHGQSVGGHWIALIQPQDDES